MRLSRLACLCALTMLAAAAIAAPAAAYSECLPGLSAESSGQGGIVVRWDPVQGQGVTGYQVMLRPIGGEWFPVQPQSPAEATSYTDLGAPADSVYEYVVIAMAGDSQVAIFCPATGTSATSFAPMTGPGAPAPAPPLWALGAAVVVTAVATVVLVRRSRKN